MSYVRAKFVKDFVNILAESADGDPARFCDRIVVGLILLFAKGHGHSSRLLFRDFRKPREPLTPIPECGGIGLSKAASFYIHNVIWCRRLQLPDLLEDQPGNAHLLLERLCALNADNRWRTVAIKRCLTPAFAESMLPAFRATASRLTKHDLGGIGSKVPYSDVARRRQSQFGEFYLKLADSGAKVPTELPLHAVFDCCPQPLQPEFTKDAELKRRLRNSIKSLNERYAYLCACGLNPEVWLDQISDKRSRELADLRQLAVYGYAQDWTDDRPEAAFRQAFNQLLEQSDKKKKKVAGFSDFEAWQESDIGQAMLRLNTVSLRAMSELERESSRLAEEEIDEGIVAENIPNLAEDEADGEDDLPSDVDDEIDFAGSFFVPGDDERQYDEASFGLFAFDEYEDQFDDPNLALQPCYKILVEYFPKVFSPLMAYVFGNLLDQDDWRSLVDDDEELAALLRQERGYDGLRGEALCDRLWRNVEALAAKNIKRFAAVFSRSHAPRTLKGINGNAVSARRAMR